MNNLTDELTAGNLVPCATIRIGQGRTPLDELGYLESPGQWVYPGNEWTWGPGIDLLDFSLTLDIQAIPAGSATLTVDGDLDGQDYSLSSGQWHPVDIILSYSDTAGNPIDTPRHVVMVIEKQSIQWDETGAVTTLTAATIETLSQHNLATNTTPSGTVINWLYNGYLTTSWHAEAVTWGEGLGLWSPTNDVLPILSEPGHENRSYPMPDDAFNVLDLAIMAIQDLGHTPFPNMDPDRVAHWDTAGGMHRRQATIAALDLVKFENDTIPARDLAGMILPGAQLDLTPEDWANELFVTQSWDATAGRQTKHRHFTATGLDAGAIAKSVAYSEDTQPWPRDTARFQAMVDRWNRRPAQLTAAMLPAYWLTPSDPIKCAAGQGYIRAVTFTPATTTLTATMRTRLRGWIGGPRWRDTTGPWDAQTTQWKG